jgi:transposase
MTTVDVPRRVTGGVDTHLDVNVAAALDAIGRLLGAEFPTTGAGHGHLLGWLSSFGPVSRVGVEGTGCYGAGLARFLPGSGVEVVEVDRANRQARRRTGKSDPADAIEAAQAAQSGPALWAAKTRDGNVEAIRALVVAKRSARSTKIKTLNQIRHLGFTAPTNCEDAWPGCRASNSGPRQPRYDPESKTTTAPPLGGLVLPTSAGRSRPH